jgi:hypothetical protein
LYLLLSPVPRILPGIEQILNKYALTELVVSSWSLPLLETYLRFRLEDKEQKLEWYISVHPAPFNKYSWKFYQ